MGNIQSKDGCLFIAPDQIRDVTFECNQSSFAGFAINEQEYPVFNGDLGEFVVNAAEKVMSALEGKKLIPENDSNRVAIRNCNRNPPTKDAMRRVFVDQARKADEQGIFFFSLFRPWQQH